MQNDTQHEHRGPHPLGPFLSALLSQPGRSAEQQMALLAAVRAYQAHPYRRRTEPAEAVAGLGSTRLMSFGGGASGPAALFVPSLINPPTILDLMAGHSLLRTLAAHGVPTLLIDWGAPGAQERTFTLDDYVTGRLLPLVHTIGSPVHAVGYCLGGTLGLAAAVLEPSMFHSLTLLATPWRFAGYGADRRAAIAALWESQKPIAERLGVLPMESLQSAFWSIDLDSMASKFLKFGTLDPESAEARLFVAIEDWANSGPPLSLPAARQLFEDFFGADAPGSGDWRIGGNLITPAAASVPLRQIAAARDRLVPREAQADCDGTRSHEVASGHVGMIVGRAFNRELVPILLSLLR